MGRIREGVGEGKVRHSRVRDQRESEHEDGNDQDSFGRQEYH